MVLDYVHTIQTELVAGDAGNVVVTSDRPTFVIELLNDDYSLSPNYTYVKSVRRQQNASPGCEPLSNYSSLRQTQTLAAFPASVFIKRLTVSVRG